MRSQAAPEHPCDAVGLGEVLLRLSAEPGGSLQGSATLTPYAGGAEANILAAFAAQGRTARLLTRLAQDPLADRLERELTSAGVEVLAGSDPAARTPLYFVEPGLPPRPTRVTYDRGWSAMCSLVEDAFDWRAATAGARVAVASGITSALSPGARAANAAFLAAAHRNGVTTAFDVNHRATLWDWSECRAETLRLLPDIDVLFASRRDVAELLPRTAAGPDGSGPLARQLLERHGLTSIVLRETRYAPDQSVEVCATVVTEQGEVTSDPVGAAVLDPFGAGDAAAGVYLDSLLHGHTPALAARRTAWAAALHHTTAGDRWIQGELPEAAEPRRIVR